MSYTPGVPCAFCHAHGDEMKKTRLLKMEQLCSSLPETTNIRHNLDIGLRVHSCCRYGVFCPRLKSFDSTCNTISRRIQNKLVTAALIEDGVIYHKVLELCRGDFPDAYRCLESIRFTHRKSK